MAEFSTTSGIPVATIKYYLREKMLPAGESETANQASYGAVHLDRLRLIRALIDAGRLSVASAHSVLEAIDSDASLPEVFKVAQRSVSAPIEPGDLEPADLASINVLLEGWHVSPENPGRLAATRVLSAFRGVGQKDERGWFARYAEAALLIAAADLDEVESRQGRAAKAETVAVGTVLGDALISGLRRAAQEHVTSQRYS
ncbi:MerR family transcriptional regulator [Subtercola sp. RTI3]|uniref:MerR family transcriptional regulator n=1 Tax=Subtercola sp. RTI3 TaxID=3048639 RepID=UPI002B22F4F5|nr:MerR family transcriptional regulator [Subtercola sp. RTI3]MEA9985983.1 MerR family transcriptional regulator [Subtercola sp. RTI3]